MNHATRNESEDHAGDRLTSRHVVVLAQSAPFPPPLIGGQIRIERIARSVAATGPTTFFCVSDVDEDEIRSGWNGAALFEDVRSFKPDLNARTRDPRWGAWWRTMAAAFPVTVPPSHRVHWSQTLVEALRSIRQKNTIVLASRAWMAEMAHAAGIERIIVDMADLESRLWAQSMAQLPRSYRHWFHQAQLRHLTRYEQRLATRFNRVIVTKESDRSFFLPDSRHRVIVAPNGVDPVQDAKRSHGLIMLFVGALGYEPNTDALLWFSERVLPLIAERCPEARFRVVGRGPAPISWGTRMRMLGVEVVESPMSLNEYYANAALVVIPLFVGEGTSLKAAEAMSYALPLVSTTVGVRGFPVTANEHYLLANEPADFADACCRVLENPVAYREMTLRSKALVDEHFDWLNVSKPIIEAVNSLAAE